MPQLRTTIAAPVWEVWNTLPELVEQWGLYGFYKACHWLTAKLHRLQTARPRKNIFEYQKLGRWTLREIAIPEHLLVSKGPLQLTLKLEEKGPNTTDLIQELSVTGWRTLLLPWYTLCLQQMAQLASCRTRTKQRKRCNEPILIRFQDRRFPACVVDISENGCRFKSEIPLFKQSQKIILQFGPQNISARLCNRDEREDLYYYGVQFEESQPSLPQRFI